MSKYVLSLDSADATLERVGGKGANLSELARAGFVVPPGFLVTTEAYRAFVAVNGLGDKIVGLARAIASDDPVALEQVSARIAELFEGGSLPAEIAQTIIEAYGSLSATGSPADPSPGPGRGTEHGAPVAVRSSATAEDLPGMSFAGQQDTYLNIVGGVSVLDAVRRCWASLWTARAIGYRARNGIAPDDVALAVVVQRLVPSEVSGVLFTANPLTGRRDEIVIDASFGLGEAIVSGQVEPDHYVVDQRSWRITGRKLGAKALAIVPRAGGGTDHVIGGDQRQALDDPQIVRLCQLSARVATHFGTPQDIEWALAGGELYLLQSRPITSLYPLPENARHETPDARRESEPQHVASPVSGHSPRVYWSLNSVQGVIEPFTPVGQDALRRGLAAGIGNMFRIARPSEQFLVEAGGRLFVDVTDITAVFMTVLAGVDPGARQTLAQLVEERRVSLKNPFSRAKVRELLPTLLPLLGRVLATLQAPQFMRARASARAERALAEARSHAARAGQLDGLIDSLERDLNAFVTQLIPQLLPLVISGVGTMKLVDHWLNGWLDLPAGSVYQLARGLPGNVTSEMDLRLWAEAQAIRADADAREFMLTQSNEGLAEAYERGELPATAQHAIERFLARYGMRGVGEIDFGRPRWREDPTPILQTIQNYLRQDDPNQAPDLIFARGAVEANRLAAEWTAQVRRGVFGAARAKLLGLAIGRMRAIMGFRESPKFYIIQLFGIYREALLAHARELAARGALEKPEDIDFVHLDQLRRFARGESLDLIAIVTAARADYERERARRRMPRLLLSTGEVFYEGLSQAGSGDLVGDPVSPGVVEGRARVVLDPRGVRLDPGEILICPATDPGWTPLFLTAGGLVMEIGGMVTHGSVVAREYGIPAVVGVHEATSLIQTGQRIRVDGTQGRITVLEEIPVSSAVKE
jgi:rifampicin phosphotransferase